MNDKVKEYYTVIIRGVNTHQHLARIIYTRFWTIAAVLLRRIKNQNTEDELHKLIVETSGHL